MKLPEHPSIKVRVGLFVLSLIGIIGLSMLLFGTIFPSDSKQSLIVQGGLLLIVLGSLLLEDKFTKPVDSIVNALAVIISIIPVYTSSPDYWVLLGLYSCSIFLAGLICILLGLPQELEGWKQLTNKALARYATTFGAARVIFSITFIMAVFSLYTYPSYQALLLISFWSVFVVLWPLKIPHLLQYLFDVITGNTDKIIICGKVLRSDNPDILQIELDIEKDIETNLMAVCHGDGKHSILKMLGRQIQEDRVVIDRRPKFRASWE